VYISDSITDSTSNLKFILHLLTILNVANLLAEINYLSHYLLVFRQELDNIITKIV
jgi:hypothetical protein